MTPPAPVRLADLRCDGCGSAEIMAIAPGEEPDVLPLGIVIRRGELLHAWCTTCWSLSHRIAS